jgi:hypothetical protein
VDVEVGERGAGRAGTGVERGWSQDEGAESRPGFGQIVIVFVSSRGRMGRGWGSLISWSRPGGGETGSCIYAMAASGRMQYEETNKQKAGPVGSIRPGIRPRLLTASKRSLY